MFRYLPLFILINIISAQDWVVKLNKKYSPAVVTVLCYDIYNERLGHGSGFNVDESGVIIDIIEKVKTKDHANQIIE